MNLPRCIYREFLRPENIGVLTGQFAASKQKLSNRYYPERPMNIRELLQYILLNCDAFIGDFYDHKILHPDRMDGNSGK